MAHHRKNKIRPIRDPHGHGIGLRGVYLLPNLLTSAGLFCGIFSISQTIAGFYFTAALALIAAQFFDGIDGRIARITNTTSRFGVEYDSLCDLVSFGVAPGVLIYQWGLLPWGVWGWLATALFVCCAALRLARFNVSAGATSGEFFTGLPVPIASAFLAGLVLIANYFGQSGLVAKHVPVLAITYTLSVLMVSTIPYPSFKNINLHTRQPLWALITGIVVLQLLVARYDVVIFLCALGYVASGPCLYVWQYAAERRAAKNAPAESDSDDQAAGA